MIQGLSLGSYIKLVDYTGRLIRQGKASMSADLASIFERLGCSDQSCRVESKGSAKAICSANFSSTRGETREIGEHFGGRRLVNLARCPVR